MGKGRRQGLWTILLATVALYAGRAAAADLAEDATPTASDEPADTAPATSEPTLFSAAWTATLGVDLAAEEPDEDVLTLRNRLDMDIKHPVSAALTARLAARLLHRTQVGHDGAVYRPALRASLPDLGMRYDALPDLREAYLQWNKPWGRLTVGRDMVNWGSLELQSPLRIVSPTDFSRGLAGMVGGDESALLPIWMVRLQRPLGPGQLDLVYVPFLDQHRFSPFATDAAFVRPGFGPELPATMAVMLRRLDLRLDRGLSESLMTALRPPAATPLDGSVGGRWSMRAGSVDLAVVALLNWDRLPALRLDPDLLLVLTKTSAAGFDVAKQVAVFADPAVAEAAQRAKGKQFNDLATATWHRRAVLGGELQFEPIDGWLVRADVAYSHQRVFMDSQFVPIVSGLVQAGAGLEKSHSDWLTVLVEATWQWAHAIARDRQLLLAAPVQVQVGGGALLRLGEGQPWLVQLGGFYGVTLHDWALAPRLRYEFNDQWQAAVGGIVADGPANSPGGFFGRDDQVIVEIRRGL